MIDAKVNDVDDIDESTIEEELNKLVIGAIRRLASSGKLAEILLVELGPSRDFDRIPKIGDVVQVRPRLSYHGECRDPLPAIITQSGDYAGCSVDLIVFDQNADSALSAGDGRLSLTIDIPGRFHTEYGVSYAPDFDDASDNPNGPTMRYDLCYWRFVGDSGETVLEKLARESQQ